MNAIRFAMVAALASLFLASCTSAGVAPNPPGGGTVGHTQLAIGMDVSPYTVSIYAKPYSGAPVVSGISTGEPWNFTSDAAGDLWVANGYTTFSGSEAVTEFTPPFSASSTPAVMITNGITAATEGVAVDSAGDLFVGVYGAHEVLEYKPPLTNTSSPAVTIPGVNGPEGLAFDSHGNLWVCQYGSSPHSVAEYSPPFTSGSTPALTITSGIAGPQTIAFNSSGDMFVADPGTDTVVEYQPPFSSGSSPVATISGFSSPQALALDSQGNLYVSDRSASKVDVFTPPFSNSSTPSSTITSGVSTPWGLTFVK